MKYIIFFRTYWFHVKSNYWQCEYEDVIMKMGGDKDYSVYYICG